LCFSLSEEGIDPVREENAELEEDLPPVMNSPGPLEHDILGNKIKHFQ
jgi:hypothetical protein